MANDKQILRNQLLFFGAKGEGSTNKDSLFAWNSTLNDEDRKVFGQ